MKVVSNSIAKNGCEAGESGKPKYPSVCGKELGSEAMRKAIPSPARHGGEGGTMVKVKRVEKETVEFDEERRKRTGKEWRTLPTGEFDRELQVVSS